MFVNTVIAEILHMPDVKNGVVATLAGHPQTCLYQYFLCLPNTWVFCNRLFLLQLCNPGLYVVVTCCLSAFSMEHAADWILVIQHVAHTSITPASSTGRMCGKGPIM